MNKVDVGIEDEIICACKEMIELENHAYASYLGTKDARWLKLLDKAREIRTKWMEKIFIEKENTQLWCFFKHTLSASKRLSEVGTKLLSTGSLEDSKQAFLDSGEIMGLYYYIRDPKDISAEGNFLENVKKGFNILKGGDKK